MRPELENVTDFCSICCRRESPGRPEHASPHLSPSPFGRGHALFRAKQAKNLPERLGSATPHLPAPQHTYTHLYHHHQQQLLPGSCIRRPTSNSLAHQREAKIQPHTWLCLRSIKASSHWGPFLPQKITVTEQLRVVQCSLWAGPVLSILQDLPCITPTTALRGNFSYWFLFWIKRPRLAIKQKNKPSSLKVTGHGIQKGFSEFLQLTLDTPPLGSSRIITLCTWNYNQGL